MSHREFVDQKGRTWDVWLVLPTSAERRKKERRVAVGVGALPYAGEERRSRISDRRMGKIRLPTITPEFSDGWLCFESQDGEKRRLMRIPESWDQMSVPELLKLCSEAKRVVRCGVR